MGIAEEVIGWWPELQLFGSPAFGRSFPPYNSTCNSTCNVKCNQCGDAFSNVVTLMKHVKALVAAFFLRAAMFGRSTLQAILLFHCTQYTTLCTVIMFSVH